MKSKALIAIAVAAAFASAGAFAGGGKHYQKGAEVHTPSTVSESAPSESLDIGSTSGLSASGSVGHDASMSSSEGVDYWRIGEESSVGSSSDVGASGSIGFSSSASPTNDEPLSD